MDGSPYVPVSVDPVATDANLIGGLNTAISNALLNFSVSATALITAVAPANPDDPNKLLIIRSSATGGSVRLRPGTTNDLSAALLLGLDRGGLEVDGPHVEALRAGLADGTIDIVATDHAPHPHEDKDCEWAGAAFGMLGLETALSIVQETMVDTGLLDWAGVAERMSYAPARIGRLTEHGQPLEQGNPANVVLDDPAARASSRPPRRASLSRNTPYAGMELPGAWSRRSSAAGRPSSTEAGLSLALVGFTTSSNIL